MAWVRTENAVGSEPWSRQEEKKTLGNDYEEMREMTFSDQQSLETGTHERKSLRWHTFLMTRWQMFFEYIFFYTVEGNKSRNQIFKEKKMALF